MRPEAERTAVGRYRQPTLFRQIAQRIKTPRRILPPAVVKPIPVSIIAPSTLPLATSITYPRLGLRMPVPPRFFDRHREYSQLLSGAHRKPATPVGTPALVCHLAFWQPDDLFRDIKTTPEELEDKWNLAVDQYLRYLFCLLLDYRVTSPNTDASKFEDSRYLFLLSHAIDLKSSTRELIGSDKLKTKESYTDRYFDKSYRSIVFNFFWHYFPVIVRIEKHAEYVQITSFIVLSEIPCNANGPIPFGTLMQDDIYEKTYRSVEILDRLLSERHRKSIDPNYSYSKVDVDANDQKCFSDIHNYLYQEIWITFINEILNSDRAIRNTDHGVNISGTVSEQYKEVTKDSKIGNIFADFRGIVLNEPHPDPKVKKGEFLQLPSWHSSTRRATAVPTNIMTSKDAAEVTYSLWPLLTIEERVDLKKYEFTVSRMLGNRALYITALGAQPSPYLGSAVGGGDDRQLPVFYLGYFQTLNRWQIGRLVDRINHLGTVRIAAIQQSEQLRDKSTQLRGLSGPIDNYLRTSSNNISQPALLALLTAAQSEIAKWTSDFPGGIHYRIERSRYYVKQFRDGVPALRIRRVEGYQPYDVFVEHRLGALFDFIHRLGLRLERFERRLNVLYQFVLVGKAAENSKKIAILQTAAEAFFLGLAAPYYIMGAADHIFSKEGLESTPGKMALGAIWAFFLSVGLTRFLAFLKMRKT